MLLASSLFASVFLVIFINVALVLLADKYEIKFKYYKSAAVSMSVIVVSVISATIAFALNYTRGADKSIIELAFSLILLWGMGVLTVTDYKKKAVPNKILLIILVLWAVITAGSLFISVDLTLAMIKESAIGGAIGGGMFLLSFLVTRGQMGAGDVKLAFLMGLYLGPPRMLMAALIGTVLCFLFSITMVLLKKMKMKDTVPMVPFLAIGVWIILLIS